MVVGYIDPAPTVQIEQNYWQPTQVDSLSLPDILNEWQINICDGRFFLQWKYGVLVDKFQSYPSRFMLRVRSLMTTPSVLEQQPPHIVDCHSVLLRERHMPLTLHNNDVWLSMQRTVPLIVVGGVVKYMGWEFTPYVGCGTVEEAVRVTLSASGS